MKLINTLFIPLLLFSCKDRPGNSREWVPNPEGETKDFSATLNIDTTDTRWHFNKYLNDTVTPQLAKDIFNNKWQLTENSPLPFLDSLLAYDEQARPFYFKIVTNSYKQADGEYAEGLGNAGYEYVKKYPMEFANYFIGPGAFTDADLITWAKIMVLEMAIITGENYSNTVVDNYLALLNENSEEATAEQRAVLAKFGNYLNAEWAAFLKDTGKQAPELKVRIK